MWHGANATSQSYLNVNNREQAERLAQRGYVVLADDFAGAPGGNNAFGNDAVSHLATGSGALAVDGLVALGAVEPVDSVAFSMGACNFLNTLIRQPARFRRAALICPVVGLADMHDNDRGAVGLAAMIETAYGGAAGYAAAVGTRDPSAAGFKSSVAAAIAGGLSLRVYYSTDDALCVPAVVLAWTAALGIETISLGAVGHYTAPNLADELADYLWAA